MTAALVLLPWTKGVLTRDKLRAWMLAAERVDAGILAGVDYPPPRVVALMCETLHDLVRQTERLVSDKDSRVGSNVDDAADFAEWIDDLDTDAREVAAELRAAEEEAYDQEQRATKAEDERDQAVKERDSLEQQRDRAEAQVAARDATLARIAALTTGKDEQP